MKHSGIYVPDEPGQHDEHMKARRRAVWSLRCIWCGHEVNGNCWCRCVGDPHRVRIREAEEQKRQDRQFGADLLAAFDDWKVEP